MVFQEEVIKMTVEIEKKIKDFKRVSELSNVASIIVLFAVLLISSYIAGFIGDAWFVVTITPTSTLAIWMFLKIRIFLHFS